MKEILEVLAAAIAPINLPFTILLILVLLYWTVVILGLIDLDSGGLDIDLAGDAGGDLDVEVGGSGGGSWGGAFSQVLKFLNAGEVPIMVILSLIILCSWTFSVLSNHYLNPDPAVWKALALLVPNLLFSALLTRYLSAPLKKVFGALNTDYDEKITIVGQVGRVVTGEVTETFGQVEIATKGAPITIQARAAGDANLKKGDQALVVDEEEKRRIFRVIKFEQPKVEE